MKPLQLCTINICIINIMCHQKEEYILEMQLKYSFCCTVSYCFFLFLWFSLPQPLSTPVPLIPPLFPYSWLMITVMVDSSTINNEWNPEPSGHHAWPLTSPSSEAFLSPGTSLLDIMLFYIMYRHGSSL